MKSKNKNSLKYLQDFKKPCFIASITTLLFADIYWKVCSWNTGIELAGINISFGITFAAFSITALSLIALLQNTKSYEILRKTKLYDNVIINYRNAIFLSFILLIIGVFGELIFSVIDGKALICYNLFSIFYITLLSAYLFINVLVLVNMLLM